MILYKYVSPERVDILQGGLIAFRPRTQQFGGVHDPFFVPFPHSERHVGTHGGGWE